VTGVDDITLEELRSRQKQSTTTDKPSEFRCDECDARCTRSPTKNIELGHRSGCPNRPEHLPYGSPDAVATDGGEQR